jgi:hypothetical protein
MNFGRTRCSAQSRKCGPIRPKLDSLTALCGETLSVVNEKGRR